MGKTKQIGGVLCVLVALTAATSASGLPRKKRPARPTPTVAPSPESSCPAILTSRRAFVAGVLGAAASAAGAYWWLSGKTATDVVVVGEAHSDPESIARKGELVQQALQGDLLVALENVSPDPEAVEDKRGIYGVEHPVANMTGAYALFRWYFQTSVLARQVGEIPKGFSAEGFAVQSARDFAVTFTGEPAELVFGGPSLEREHFHKSRLRLSDEAAARAFEAYEKLVRIVATKEGNRELRALRAAPFHADPSKLSDLTANQKEAVSLLRSDSGEQALAVADEVFRERLLAKLRAGRTDPILQTPDYVIEYVEGFPSLEAFPEAPYNGAIYDPVFVDWRNAIMGRFLEKIVLKGARRGLPVFLVVGKRHQPGMVSLLGKLPNVRVRQESSTRLRP